jgi:hypothetical protein
LAINSKKLWIKFLNYNLRNKNDVNVINDIAPLIPHLGKFALKYPKGDPNEWFIILDELMWIISDNWLNVLIIELLISYIYNLY